MKTPFNYASEYYSPEKERVPLGANRVRIEKLVRLVGRNKVVLDVGCYDGTISAKIRSNGNTVHGIDASETAVANAKKKGINCKVADLEKRFPFKAGTFDIVVAGEILEHLVDTDTFLGEISRVLKKDGVLVLSTPNAASLGRRIMLLFGLNPFFEASLGFPKNATAGHLRFFTKRLLIDFLKYKGFEIAGFESDVINFPYGFSSKFLADLIPTLGQSLILTASKRKKH